MIDALFGLPWGWWVGAVFVIAYLIWRIAGEIYRDKHRPKYRIVEVAAKSGVTYRAEIFCDRDDDLSWQDVDSFDTVFYSAEAAQKKIDDYSHKPVTRVVKEIYE